jgi:SSS family solute:Na+ symporter
MADNNLWLYWIIFVLYMIFLAVAGIRAKKKTNSLSDFMVAGRSIGPILLGLSYGVTYFSSVLIIGGGEYAWNWGLGTLYIAALNVFVGIFCVFVLFGKRTQRMAKQFGVYTVPQLIARRYDSKFLQYLSSLVILVFETVYLVSIYMGLSILLQVIFPEVPSAYNYATIIVGTISIFYLTISGSHGMIITDVVESIIMVVGVVTITIGGLQAVGGISGMEATLIDVETFIGKPGGLTTFPGAGGFGLIGFILVTSFGTWGMPQMISRLYTAKDYKALKWGLFISVIWAVVISFLAYLNGVIGRAYFFVHPDASVNAVNVIPKMMVAILPVILASLVIAAVTAASLTTGEKVILMAASAFSIDFYQSITKASDEKTMRVTQVVTAIVVAVGVVLAILKPDAVLALAMFAWSAMASTILVPYVFGLFWKRGTAPGAISAGIAAFTVTILWWLCFRSAGLNGVFNTNIFPLLPALGDTVIYTSNVMTVQVKSIHEFITSQVAALVVFLVVSLLTKPPKSAEVEEYFAKKEVKAPTLD